MCATTVPEVLFHGRFYEGDQTYDNASTECPRAESQAPVLGTPDRGDSELPAAAGESWCFCVASFSSSQGWTDEAKGELRELTAMSFLPSEGVGKGKTHDGGTLVWAVKGRGSGRQ